MNYIFGLIVFVFGSAIGSFLNVVILRLPRGEKITGRSHCPHCLNTLTAKELIPIFSYFWQNGRCRHCGKKISPRYFAVELISALFFCFAWFWLKPLDLFGALLFIKSLFLIAALIAIFTIDLEHYLILDKVLVAAGLPLVAINLIIDLNSRQPLFSLSSLTIGGIAAGLVLGGFFYLLWLVSKGKWMGFGDVKLMLFLSLALGWPAAIVCWFLAFILGFAYSLPLLLMHKKHLTSRLPFGTFLSLAAFIAFFWGGTIFIWYLSVLGF